LREDELCFELWLGWQTFLSYEKIDVLITAVHHSSPDAARRRLRWRIFFAAWTVFAALAVWWMIRRAVLANASPSWFFEGDAADNASLGERIGNWLKLVDLNFHETYPWILMAPYVGWLGTRFQLEGGQWRRSLAVHLVSCALFVAVCYGLTAYNGLGRQVVVAFSSQIKTGPDGKTFETNNVTIRTNAPPGAWGHGEPGQATYQVLVGGPNAGEPDLPSLAIPDAHGGVVLRRRFVGGPLAILDPLAYAALVGIVHSVRFHRRSREREERASALEAQLTKARLSALQAQLHPHFLFNALNAISTLLRRDTRAAQDALTSFSELLRMALAQSTEPEVTLREDLEFVRRYVEIQQTRLGERLQFEEVIAPGALDCLVPALFLQPLVENAIRHGIEPSANAGVVRVIVQQRGERLLAIVEDNGAGLSNTENERGGGMGLGLQNLRARLESLYGKAQSLDFAPRPEGGVKVRVELPLHPAPHEETALVAQ
jgi:two-component sensor histidine kinase